MEYLNLDRLSAVDVHGKPDTKTCRMRGKRMEYDEDCSDWGNQFSGFGAGAAAVK